MRRAGQPRFSLIVDQFEELFTLCEDPDERKAFLDNIIGTSGSDPVAHVIISLRADFYHRCSEHDSLRNLVQSHQIYIGAMNKTELLRTIEQPSSGLRLAVAAGSGGPDASGCG